VLSVLALLVAAPTTETRVFRLDNGLQVAIQPDLSRPWVTVGAVYRSGASSEQRPGSGLAHLVEHLAFQRTAHASSLALTLESIPGAEYNGWTEADATAYIETVPSAYVSRALWVEAERMGFLCEAIDQPTLDREKPVVLAERRERLTERPYGTTDAAITGAMYPTGHPLREGAIGTAEGIAANTLAEVRSFCADHYHPGNAALVVAGAFDPSLVEKVIREYFASLRAGPSSSPAVLGPNIAGRTIRIGEPVAKRGRVSFVWRGPEPASVEASDLELLAHLIRGRLSRIGVANWTEVALEEVDAALIVEHGASLFRVDAEVAPGMDLEIASRRLERMIETYVEYPPDARALASALRGIEVSYWAASVDVGGRTASVIHRYLRSGTFQSVTSVIARWRRSTPESVAKSLEIYLRRPPLVVLAQPIGDSR